jgi:hypothetical protein
LSCSNVSGGVIILVMISYSVKDNNFAVIVWKNSSFIHINFFLIGIVGGGVHLGPLGTAGANEHIVPAPGDYDDGEIGGMMIGRGNRSTQRKPAPLPLWPPQIPHAARTRTRATAVGSQRLTA